MTYKERILKVLKEDKLTSREIADKTGIEIDLIYVYLNRMVKESKLKRVNEEIPYIYERKKDLGELKIEAYKQLIAFFEELIQNNSKLFKINQLHSFKEIINKNIDIDLIKMINGDLSYFEDFLENLEKDRKEKEKGSSRVKELIKEAEKGKGKNIFGDIMNDLGLI